MAMKWHQGEAEVKTHTFPALCRISPREMRHRADMNPDDPELVQAYIELGAYVERVINERHPSLVRSGKNGFALGFDAFKAFNAYDRAKQRTTCSCGWVRTVVQSVVHEAWRKDRRLAGPLKTCGGRRVELEKAAKVEPDASFAREFKRYTEAMSERVLTWEKVYLLEPDDPEGLTPLLKDVQSNPRVSPHLRETAKKLQDAMDHARQVNRDAILLSAYTATDDTGDEIEITLPDPGSSVEELGAVTAFYIEFERFMSSHPLIDDEGRRLARQSVDTRDVKPLVEYIEQLPEATREALGRDYRASMDSSK